MMKIWISQRKVLYKHSNQLNCRCLITPTIFFSFNSVISIQLRHRFLCSPLFLFSLLSLSACSSTEKTIFPSKKKKQFSSCTHTHTHTERESDTGSVQEWISDLTELQERKSGRLCFFVLPP